MKISNNATIPASNDPFDYFTGREDVIGAFERLMSPSARRRILMVDGLSGTGKSFLIEWLQQHRCGGVANAHITLSPVFHEKDILRTITMRFGAEIGRAYSLQVEEIERAQGQHPFVQVDLTQTIEGRLSGRVSDADQSFVVNMGDSQSLVETQRRAQRLDILAKVLEPMDTQPWVLFLDETEHLSQPALRRFIIQEFVPRMLVSFPYFRLYLSGQTTPTEAFSQHEYRHMHLDTFTADESATMLQKAQLDDAELWQRIHDFTGGHPLLLGMWLDYVIEGGPLASWWELDAAPFPLDEASRTQWIYDRIVDRFDDSFVQHVAANLSLLEWFDLGLIRAVFSSEISDEAFRQMVRRSFVKPLGGGRWCCHDIIRQHLPAYRHSVDPEGCRQIHERAAAAFQTRIDAEEQRAGKRYFPNRLFLTTAEIASLLQVSLHRAEEVVLAEIAIATVASETEYLFGVARYLERQSESESLQTIAQQSKTFLEALSVRRVNPSLLPFLERLISWAELREETEIAAWLLCLAARVVSSLGQTERAASLAERAYVLEPSDENYALGIEVALRAGDQDRAWSLLEAARARCGDTPKLRMAEVDLVAAHGEESQVVRRLTELIAEFPDNAEDALMKMAELLMSRNDSEGAEEQLKRVLECNPHHADALMLYVDILVSRGEITRGAELIRGLDMPVLVDRCSELAAVFSDLQFRGRVLAEFQQDPTSQDLTVLSAMAEFMAVEGMVEEVDELVARIDESWPEFADLGDVIRAEARLQGGRAEAVLPLLQPLVDRGLELPGLYLILARVYNKVGEPERQRETLQQGIERFPSLRSLLEAQYAQSLASDQGMQAALAYLRQLEQKGMLSPECMKVKAELLVTEGRDQEALNIFERLIYTEDRESMTLPALIQARQQVALLLLKLNRRDEGVQVCDSLIDLFPSNTTAIMLASQVYAALGDERGMRKALASMRGTTMPVIRAMLVGALGQLVARREQDIDRLLNELREHPDRAEILVAADVLMTTNGQLDKMTMFFAEAEKIAPGLLQQYQKLRETMLTNNASAVLPMVRAAVEANPGNLPFRVGLAETLAALGSLDEAMAVFDELLEGQPGIAEMVTSWKAANLMKAGRLEEAEALIAPYLQPGVDLPEILYGPARRLLERDDLERQIAFHQRVADASASLRPIALENMIDLLYVAGRQQEALSAVETMETEGPLPAGVQLSKVRVLRALDRVEDALEIVEQLTAMENVSNALRAHALCEKAEIYIEQGQLENAAEVYLAALRYNPDSNVARLSLSKVYEELSCPEDAYEILMDAVATQPSLAAQLTERLQNLRRAVRGQGE